MTRKNEISPLRAARYGYHLKQTAVSSNDPHAWAALSMDLFCRKLTADADEIANKAISMDPDNPELYWNLARQLFRRGDTAAIEALLVRLDQFEHGEIGRLRALSLELKRWLQETRDSFGEKR